MKLFTPLSFIHFAICKAITVVANSYILIEKNSSNVERIQKLKAMFRKGACDLNTDEKGSCSVYCFVVFMQTAHPQALRSY